MTSYDYLDNGWTQDSNDPAGITTSYAYNDLGEQTSRVLDSPTGDLSRTMSWGYYPDGKLASVSDHGVPTGLYVEVTEATDVGAKPDPVAAWPATQCGNTAGCEGTQFQTHAAGSGTDSFTWPLYIPADGNYTVYVKYPVVSGEPVSSMFTGKDENDATPSATSTTQPYSYYRFNAMRWDSTTGQYDMGFRTYDPGLNQFTSRDMYDGALADSGLSADPFTGSQYAFGDGNPVTNIENDGHMPCIAGGPCGSFSALARWSEAQQEAEQAPSGIAAYSGGNVLIVAPSKAALNSAINAAQYAIGNGTGFYFPGEVGYPVTSNQPVVKQAIAESICQSHSSWCANFNKPPGVLGQINNFMNSILPLIGGMEGDDEVPVTRELSASEQATGARLQALLGEQLTDFKVSSHVGEEWTGTLNGQSVTIDAMGGPDAVTHWNESQFLRAIDKHLLKSGNYTAIDLTGFNADQAAAVYNYLGTLPEKSVNQIVVIPPGGQ